jgi:hypothetical protein
MSKDPFFDKLKSLGYDPSKVFKLDAESSTQKLISNADILAESERFFQLEKKENSAISNIVEKSYLVNNQDSLLSVDQYRDVAVEKPSFGEIMAYDFGVSPKGETINLDKITLDPKTKQSFNSVANVLSRKINQGDEKALLELKSYFQKAFDSGSLSNEAKQKLKKEYDEISNTFKNKNVYSLASNNINNYLNNKSEAEKNDFLKRLSTDNLNQNASKFIYDIGLENDEQRKQLFDKMLDLNSFVPGSFVYNKENLNSVKNAKNGLSPLFNSPKQYTNYLSNPLLTSMVISTQEASQKEYLKEVAAIDQDYANLMSIAAKNKQKELQGNIQKLNEELKQDPNNNWLLTEKNKLEKDLSFTQQLTNKLAPLESKKTFYKSFYPQLYNEEVRKEKSEIAYNDLAMSSWTDHPLRKAKSIAYRSIEQTASNLINQASGVNALFGDYSTSLGLNLAAKAAAPPQYRRVQDLNKNFLVEPNEVIKDSNGEPIYVSNVVWTDEKGKSHWNISAAAEQTLPIAVDIAESAEKLEQYSVDHANVS